MQEGTNKGMDCGCCGSMMGAFFNQGAKDGKSAPIDFQACGQMMKNCCSTQDGKIDFTKCEQMMKDFCGAKDGKIDFAACMSKMEQFCKTANKEPDNNTGK